MKKLILLLCTLLLVNFSFSQTILGDSIMSDSVLRKVMSPYILTDSFYLHDSATLTLEAGAVLQFDSIPRAIINGNLKALGTLQDSVVLEQRFPRPIEIQLAGTDSNTFAFTHFRLFCDTVKTSNSPLDSLHTSRIIIDTTAYYNFQHSRFSKPAGRLFRQPTYFIRKAGVTFTNCEFDQVALSVNNPDFDGYSIVDFSSFVPAVFDTCEFSGCYLKTEKNSFLNSRFRRGIVLFTGSSLFQHCVMESSSFWLKPHKFDDYPVPLLNTRLDTAIFIDNSFFNNDTSRNRGIFGIIYVRRGWGGSTGGQSIGIYPALSFNFNEVCVKGTMPMDSLYPGWDLTNNCWCETDTQAILDRFPQDTTIGFSGQFRKEITAQDIIPFNSNCIAEVYPGDANHDHLANIRDLLPIGLQYGNTGPVRNNASLNWIGQPADNWTTASPSGLNDKHADCNGDGTVDDNDTLAIHTNFNLIHPTFKNGSSGIPVTVRPTVPGSYKRGDTVTYRIDWGDMSNAVQNGYGVTLSMHYDTSQWNSSSLRVLYPNAWLGTPNNDMLTMTYHDSTSGRLDLGWVRTDGMTRNGFGQIGSIVIVLDDDISKRGIPVSWEILDSYAIDNQALSIDLAATFDTVYVDYATPVAPDLSTNLLVFPNPSHDGRFMLSWLETMGSGRIAVFDIYGKMVLEKALSAGKTEEQIWLKGLPAGTYILKVDIGNHRMLKKVVLQ